METDVNTAVWVGGMTLRDYFAAAAMQGMIACTRVKEGYPGGEQTARLAYEFSDYMLAKRTK